MLKTLLWNQTSCQKTPPHTVTFNLNNSTVKKIFNIDSEQFLLSLFTSCVLTKVTDYSSSSEDSESSDEDGETVGHDGTVAVSDIPRIM